MANTKYTQKDIDLLFSHNKVIRMKAILLDEYYREIEDEQFTGRIKSSSFNISAESDIRRTCTLTMIIDDKSMIHTTFERTWINRIVELSCGIFDFSANDYVWYKLGRMLMTDGETSFSATTQEVRMSLVDLIASISEARGSQIGSPTSILAGSTIGGDTGVIAQTISEFSQFKLTNIADFPDVIPYDIDGNIGDYPYDILKRILSLFPYYEMYYDVDGTFVVQEIPTKIEDDFDVSCEIIDRALLSENTEKRGVRYSDVKNTIELWGCSLHAKFTATRCSTTSETDANGAYSLYTLSIGDTFESLVVGDTYGFTPETDSIAGQRLRIDDSEIYVINTQKGNGELTPLTAGAMKANIPYVVKYTDGGFVLMGELEIHVIVQEIQSMPSSSVQQEYKQSNACREIKWIVNPSSPFACVISPTTKKINRDVKRVLEGGEYSNIYTTQLAYERACYELYVNNRLKDFVTLEMLYMPWLDVNDKIEYTSPSSGEKVQLLVQTIEPDFSKWTMTVKGAKFYPVYPW